MLWQRNTYNFVTVHARMRDIAHELIIDAWIHCMSYSNVDNFIYLFFYQGQNFHRTTLIFLARALVRICVQQRACVSSLQSVSLSVFVGVFWNQSDICDGTSVGQFSANNDFPIRWIFVIY